MSSSPKVVIAPSLLNSDFAVLGQTATKIMSCGADWLHMDVMVRYVLSSVSRPFVWSLLFVWSVSHLFLLVFIGWVGVDFLSRSSTDLLFCWSFITQMMTIIIPSFSSYLTQSSLCDPVTLSTIWPLVHRWLNRWESTPTHFLTAISWWAIQRNGSPTLQRLERISTHFILRQQVCWCDLCFPPPFLALYRSNKQRTHILLSLSLSLVEDPEKLIQTIKDHNMLPAVAIKPKTSIEKVLPILDMVNLVLVMVRWTKSLSFSRNFSICIRLLIHCYHTEQTVEPGFGGQGFMSDMMTKVLSLSLFLRLLLLLLLILTFIVIIIVVIVIVVVYLQGGTTA